MSRSVVYMDFSEVKLSGGSRMTELTWLDQDSTERVPHHYFVDYPGAKESERSIAEVLGGKPLVRYSMPTVIMAFSTHVAGRMVFVESPEKMERFLEYVEQSGLPNTFIFSLFTDQNIKTEIDDARYEAARKFGNAL